MKKSLLALTLAMVFFGFLGSSNALIIDIGSSTYGEVVKLQAVTQSDLDNNFNALLTPWLEATVTNDTGQDGLFELVSIGWGNDLTLHSQGTNNFKSLYLGGAGDSFTGSLIDIIAGKYDPASDSIVSVPVGTKNTIYSLFIVYNWNDVQDTEMVDIAFGATPWVAEVVGIDDPGSSPVPEPATMLLFGTGLAGLAGAVRRKK